MPFKPGESGNPQGRKRGKTDATKLKETAPSAIDTLINAATAILDRGWPA